MKKIFILLMLALLLIPNVFANDILYNSTEDYTTGTPTNTPWLYKCYNSGTYYLMTWDGSQYDCDNVPTDQTGYPNIRLLSNQIYTHSGTNTADWDSVIEFEAQETDYYNITYNILMNGVGGNIRKFFVNNTGGEIISEVMTTGELWSGSFLINMTVGESIYLHQNRNDGSNANDNTIKNEILVSKAYSDDLLIISAKDSLNSSSINNFNISLYYPNGTLFGTNSTTNGLINFNLTGEILGNYTAYFIANLYSNANATINFNNNSVSYQFSVAPAPSVNMSFYNDRTLNLINDRTINIELWNDYEGFNLSTTNGYKYQKLNYDGTYTIKFAATNYSSKFYTFDIDYKENKLINLYLTESNQLTNVTATIQDQNLNTLEGAILVVEKFNILDGNYLISERITADFEGKVRFKARLFEDYYRFKIYFNEELVFSSIPTTIKNEEINFIITISDGVTEGFNDILNINYEHYFDEVNNRFVFTYSNVKGTVTGVNVYTHRLTNNGQLLIDTTSQASASGTIYHNVNNITGYKYKSCAYGIIEDNTEELISCEFVEFDTEITEAAHGLALFWLLMITILFAMAALYNITVGLIITPLPFLAFEILGLTTLGLPYAISIQVLFIVVALVINK